MAVQRLVILLRATDPRDADPSPLEIREASPDDARAYARDIGSYTADAFTKRLTEKNSCYLAFEGGRVLHASWCATRPTWTEELRTYLSPPPGDAYVYESFTRPDARGRGIYPLVLSAIADDLFDRGIGRIWIGVDAGNEASLRAIRKAGFAEVFSITFSGEPGHVESDPPALDPDSSLHIVESPAHDP